MYIGLYCNNLEILVGVYIYVVLLQSQAPPLECSTLAGMVEEFPYSAVSVNIQYCIVCRRHHLLSHLLCML